MDASGRRELIRLIAGLKDVTIILVTHNLEDFLEIVDRCIILSEARLAADIRKDHLIRSLDVFQSAGIVPPLVLRVQDWLAKEGVNLPRTVFDMDQLIGLLRHSR